MNDDIRHAVTIDFQIDEQVARELPPIVWNAQYGEKLVSAAQVALELAGWDRPALMSLVLTDDLCVRDLNRQYRGLDATTDVLAFGAAPEGDEGFVSPPGDEIPYLGDVIIALPQAARQAQERGHTLVNELCLLTVHGTLHLVGYDHAEEAQRREMWPLQRAAMRRLGCEMADEEDEQE